MVFLEPANLTGYFNFDLMQLAMSENERQFTQFSNCITNTYILLYDFPMNILARAFTTLTQTVQTFLQTF